MACPDLLKRRSSHSDNGPEFINDHLYRYCQERRHQFTRCRPYKKDDNAPIEQKNWTHVRKVFGWKRYDTPELLVVMNDLYANELRLMINLFQPSVKLRSKHRVGLPHSYCHNSFTPSSGRALTLDERGYARSPG